MGVVRPSETIPRWLQHRFGQLWERYHDDKAFSLTDATDVLKDSREVVAVILSRLRKSGWLNVAFDEEDARKRNYTLKNPAKIYSNLAPQEMTSHAQNHKD